MVKSSKATKKTSRPASRKRAVKTVDYYPNRMTLAVSVIAGSALVLFALILAFGM